ncbi:hypothetical protein B0H13DRAFT_551575 [Mycena leptocephala]|nr:hypothetical protein B0H13DRAFT_551575 [Mycena leptocephala]
MSLGDALPPASASSCSPRTPRMEDGLEGTASAYGQENPPSERKRMGREGAPRAQRVLLVAQDRPDFVDGPPTPVFQRLAVCRRRNARPALSLAWCFCLLSAASKRARLDDERPASAIFLGAHGPYSLYPHPLLTLTRRFRRRDDPALGVACSFSSAFWSKVTRCDPAPPPAPPLPSACRAGTLLLARLPLAASAPSARPTLIWHATTLDVRRAVRMGLAACPGRRRGAAACRVYSLRPLPPMPC